jgi:hypothetical protein
MIFRITLLLAIMTLQAACAGPPKCETQGRYRLSQEGRRIQAPDGLDDLESYKEMTIPRASPQPEHPDTGRCLEAPPGIATGGSS